MQMKSLVWLVVCWCTVVECVVQYKVRGPPVAQRLPHMPHYPKAKWQTTLRPPTRPYLRPMPLQMASYKVPVVARPPKTPTPLIFPSAVWKTPTAVYRPPVEKPFLTSPPVTQSYEFHLNKDPILSLPTIKQVGEKGPIHTIPAPNLSPADKPSSVIDEPVQKYTYQYVKKPEVSSNSISASALSSSTVLGAHTLPLIQSQQQYQVTESVDPTEQLVQNQFNGQKSYYAPDPDPTALFQKLPHLPDTNSLSNGVKLLSTDLLMTPQQLGAMPLSTQELYQLLNGIPQQHLLDGYGLLQQQPVQQQFMQPASAYQSLLNSPALLHQDAAYLNQIPAVVSQQVKNSFKPQFHTFNYEEQSSRNVPNKEFAQSRVTADYSLEPDVAETNVAASVQNANEALAQTQYIQQYFTNHESAPTDHNNNVDSNLAAGLPHNNNKGSEILTRLSVKNEISPSMFYSSLPSREAAEALASLQAAGSVNSNLIKLAQKRTQTLNPNQIEQKMRIYVPDDDDNYEDMETQASGDNANAAKESNHAIKIYETTYVNHKGENKSESAEYEDYSSEDDKQEASSESSDSPYANRFKSKTSET